MLSALPQMRVKRMGRGPCCVPCQRFRPWTERYHEWMNKGTLWWPICTDPQISTSNSLNWQIVCFLYLIVWLKWCDCSSVFFVFWQTKVACVPKKGYPHCINCLCCSVAQQSVHEESPEMQADIESLCLLSRELGRAQQPNPWSWNIRPAVKRYFVYI